MWSIDSGHLYGLIYSILADFRQIKCVGLLLFGTGIEREGMERAGIERAGMERAGIERAGMERAGMERAGMERVYRNREG